MLRADDIHTRAGRVFGHANRFQHQRGHSHLAQTVSKLSNCFFEVFASSLKSASNVDSTVEWSSCNRLLMRSSLLACTCLRAAAVPAGTAESAH